MTDAETEVEALRKMVAFYQGEMLNSSHPVERQYRRLVLTLSSKRTKKQVDRLIVLARACAKAIDASDKAFRDELDKFVWMEKCRRKFSLCLDCELKNRCERYSKHLKGTS